MTSNDMFTAEDVKSLYYRRRELQGKNRILVQIFSKTLPIGGGYQHAKNLTKDANREEWDDDVVELRTFFRNTYNVLQDDIEVHHGCTVNEVHDIMNKLGKNPKTKDYDIFFFIFLTYLGRSEVAGQGPKKEERLQFEDDAATLDTFMDDIKDSEAFWMKPKIFLVQADDLSIKFPKDVPKGGESIKKMKIPSDADRLVIMSTIPQFFAILPKKKQHKKEQPKKEQPKKEQPLEEGMGELGITDPTKVLPNRSSLMIQAFIEVMSDDAYKGDDLLTKTTYINGKVKQLINEIDLSGTYADLELPIPLVTSTLTKFLEM